VTGVVLEASAAVEIVLDTARGLGLASKLPTDGDVMAPDHFFAEAGAALRRMENHGDLTHDRATLALRRVRSLRVRRVSTRDLLPAGWDLRRNLIIGDGLDVALARRLDVVTADGRLARAPGLGVRVFHR